MKTEDDDIVTAISSILYDDPEISDNTGEHNTSPKYTRRGHLRRLKTTNAVQRLVRGVVKASGYTASLLTKFISRCRAYNININDDSPVPTSTRLYERRTLNQKIKCRAETLLDDKPDIQGCPDTGLLSSYTVTVLKNAATTILDKLVRASQAARTAQWREQNDVRMEM